MLVFSETSTRSWSVRLAAISMILTGLSWQWFVMCFTARTGAWWSSIYFFVIVYALATSLAVCGIRSALAILALLLAVPSLGIVCIFAFAH